MQAHLKGIYHLQTLEERATLSVGIRAFPGRGNSICKGPEVCAW